MTVNDWPSTDIPKSVLVTYERICNWLTIVVFQQVDLKNFV